MVTAKKVAVTLIATAFVILCTVIYLSVQGKNFTGSEITDDKVLITDSELNYIENKMFDMFADNFDWQLRSVEKRTLADSERIANYIGKSGALTPSQLKKFIDPNFPYTEVYFALETDGKYIGTSDSADMSVDYRTRPWYVGAKAADGAFITDPYDTVTNKSGEKIVTFSYPIINKDGKLLGVVGIDMNGSELMQRLLPRSLAPYISGIIIADGNGGITPFFDWKSAEKLAETAEYRKEIKSDFHNWTVRIYGDFSEYEKILRKMTFTEAKNSYDLDAVSQMTFQLESSTSYIEFNVGRNASVYSNIEVEKTPAFMKNIAMSINTEHWVYDDIYFVFETDGKYIGIDETVSDEIDFRSRPWYIAAKESLEVTRTDFYISISGSRQKIMTFCAPLLDKEGNFVGAVGFDITTDSAKSLLYNGDASLESLLILIS
jgi:hypothetical protein